MFLLKLLAVAQPLVRGFVVTMTPGTHSTTFQQQQTLMKRRSVSLSPPQYASNPRSLSSGDELPELVRASGSVCVLYGEEGAEKFAKLAAKFPGSEYATLPAQSRRAFPIELYVDGALLGKFKSPDELGAALEGLPYRRRERPQESPADALKSGLDKFRKDLDRFSKSFGREAEKLGDQVTKQADELGSKLAGQETKREKLDRIVKIGPERFDDRDERDERDAETKDETRTIRAQQNKGDGEDDDKKNKEEEDQPRRRREPPPPPEGMDMETWQKKLVEEEIKRRYDEFFFDPLPPSNATYPTLPNPKEAVGQTGTKPRRKNEMPPAPTVSQAEREREERYQKALQAEKDKIIKPEDKLKFADDDPADWLDKIAYRPPPKPQTNTQGLFDERGDPRKATSDNKSRFTKFN